MFMYTDNYETEELNAFDLSTVRVDYNKDMENLLQVGGKASSSNFLAELRLCRVYQQ